ncbi:alpha/beta hydrolase, partial [Streptomyces sp. NPDC049577]
MRPTAIFGAAGTVVTGALVAGFLAAPAASAGERVPGGAAEAAGVKIAAAKAAKTGVKWQDCPADWGFDKPIQCGYVTVPVDYAKPNGRTIKIAVDRARSTGT